MRQRDFDQIADTLRQEMDFATPEEFEGIKAAAGALSLAWHKQNPNLDEDRFWSVFHGYIKEGIW